MESKRELAIITNISYGLTEHGVGMLFGVQLLNGATVLFMEVSSVTSLLTESKINNIMSIQGRPCVVNVDVNGTVSFEKII